MESLLYHQSIFNHVIDYLSKRDIARLAQTCQRFRSFVYIHLDRFVNSPMYFYRHSRFDQEKPNYLQMYQYYFERHVLISDFETISPKCHDSIFQIGIMKFNKGRYFTAVWLRNRDLVLYDTIHQTDEIQLTR